MKPFNESEPYWGDKQNKTIGASDERFTMRSVKIFTDGESILFITIYRNLPSSNLQVPFDLEARLYV